VEGGNAKAFSHTHVRTPAVLLLRFIIESFGKKTKKCGRHCDNKSTTTNRKYFLKVLLLVLRQIKATSQRMRKLYILISNTWKRVLIIGMDT